MGMDTVQIEALVALDRKLPRFYLPPEVRWNKVREQTSGLGERLTETLRNVAKENPKL